MSIKEILLLECQRLYYVDRNLWLVPSFREDFGVRSYPFYLSPPSVFFGSLDALHLPCLPLSTQAIFCTYFRKDCLTALHIFQQFKLIHCSSDCRSCVWMALLRQPLCQTPIT